MKCVRKDITGQRFGRYVVLDFAFIKQGRAYWKCECDCGTIKNVRGSSLRIGQTKSCGCYAKERSSIMNSGEGHPFYGKKRPEHSRKMKGINHPRYNHSLTEEERQIGRTYTEYREWRTAVYERDKYTCQCCGTKKGPFNAHHLGAYNRYTKLRISLWNGITLCKKCHVNFHNEYGRGGNTVKQFKEFILEHGKINNEFVMLEDIDFVSFFKHIELIFNTHFSYEDTKQIMEYVEILSDANFRCYIANSAVISIRKSGIKDYELISNLEWVARSVGEFRVASKANINRHISRLKTISNTTSSINWTSDDVVYGIGEMMDRLSIEYIKREDFSKNNRPKHMINASQGLSDRVEKYLKAKLLEIDKKGFYECINEQRTYDIEGILEELII